MEDVLNVSELGSKSYWDDAYSRELQNHAEDAEDEGTVWFDDTGAEEKVLELLERLEDDGILAKRHGSNANASSFIDIGTGNGHMLFALKDDGWEGQLVGVDYSATSVELARQIAQRRQTEGMHPDAWRPKFEQWDLLNETPGAWSEVAFDVTLDKGTFDAISLSSETGADGRRPHESYLKCVLPIIKPGGLFIITSCNWTRDEILKWFAGQAKLQLLEEVKYPSFTFGGKQGQSVCTLAFKRQSI